MRKIIEITAGGLIDLESEGVDLEKVKIERIWTVFDEKEMWDSCKFNPYTGKPVETLEDLVLEHHKGVFLEDYVHDWNIRRPGNKLDYYSRVVAPRTRVKILIEYQEK